MCEPVVSRALIEAKAKAAFESGVTENPLPVGSEAWKTWNYVFFRLQAEAKRNN